MTISGCWSAFARQVPGRCDAYHVRVSGKLANLFHSLSPEGGKKRKRQRTMKLGKR
jgi:hypothetical protein